MEGTDIASALTQVNSIATSALNIITSNSILFVMFCGGLMGVGFRVIQQAKHTAQ